jgi:hypothetical protein
MTWRNAVRPAAWFLIVMGSLRLASSTPLSVAGLVGPVRWKPGATVTVYIPLDPLRADPDTPRTRNVQVSQAVDEWVKALKDAGVNLTLKAVTLDANGNIPGTGKPPDSTKDTPDNGSIPITWQPVKGEGGDATPGLQENPDPKKTGPLVTDEVKLDDSATAFGNLDNAKALAAALHELGHALGLDHDKSADSVMHEDLDTEPKTKVGASDVRELKSVYTASNSHLDSIISPLGGGIFAYNLTATWLSGGETPMVQFLTFGADMENVSLPPGWIDVSYTGIPNPDVVTFRVDPTDALQAYLNQSNPSLTFSFNSHVAPQTTLGWAGDFQSVTAPAVPEPASWPTLGIGLAIIFLLLRRRSSESRITTGDASSS